MYAFKLNFWALNININIQITFSAWKFNCQYIPALEQLTTLLHVLFTSTAAKRRRCHFDIEENKNLNTTLALSNTNGPHFLLDVRRLPKFILTTHLDGL